MNSKDKSITDLLGRLDLVGHGWQVVDNWEADLCAIGIARQREPRRLVYISTYGKPAGRYYYETEVPGRDNSDYEAIDEGDNVSYEQLLQVLVKHLG